jgi:hypothetical protein
MEKMGDKPVAGAGEVDDIDLSRFSRALALLTCDDLMISWHRILGLLRSVAGCVVSKPLL